MSRSHRFVIAAGALLFAICPHAAPRAQVAEPPATEPAPAVVVGVLGAARAQPLLEVIARYAKEIHLVVPKQARASSQEELAALLPATFAGRVLHSTVAELFPSAQACTAGKPGETVVVTGSVYLIGEVLERIAPERGAGEGRLQDF